MSCQKLALVAVAAVLLATGSALSFKLQDCAAGNKTEAKLVSLKIDTCPDQEAERCVFYIGRNATMTMELEPTAVFEEANIKIGALVKSVYVPFAFDGPKDACGNYGLTCPPSVGQKQALTMSLKVDKTLYPLRATVRFQLRDQKSDTILCAPVELRRHK